MLEHGAEKHIPGPIPSMFTLRSRHWLVLVMCMRDSIELRNRSAVSHPVHDLLEISIVS